MRRLCGFFAILILACAVAACSEPEDEVEVDFMWVELKYSAEYKTGDPFSPIRELDVYTSYQGVKNPLSLKLVTISIAKPPYLPDDLKHIEYDDEYKLEVVGTNLIIVEYAGLSAISPIEVKKLPDGITVTVTWEK
jgi:hypothetical protein